MRILSLQLLASLCCCHILSISSFVVGRSHSSIRPQENAARSTKVAESVTAGGTTTAFLLSPQDIIETGVSLNTFAPQFLWLPMIVAPTSPFTKELMGRNGILPIVALSLVHLTIVGVAAAQEGALSQILIFQEVFDPSMSQLDGMQKLFDFPNFVAEEWPHVLIWDLFVGRAIWLDGIQRGINTRFALLFCNFIGPPGLLIHVATCLITGKGLPPLGWSSSDELEA